MLTTERFKASSELWLEPGPSRNFLLSTSLNFIMSRRLNNSAPCGSSTEIAPLCMSWIMSALEVTTSVSSSSERLGWKAASGGMSADVNFDAIFTASAASGWNTNAACPCLISLETWGRDSSASGKVSASTTLFRCSRRARSPHDLQDKVEPQPSLQCPPHSPAWMPGPAPPVPSACHRHWKALLREPANHPWPMWCHFQWQKEANDDP